MNSWKVNVLGFAMVTAITLTCGSRPARALEARTTLAPIGQVDLTSWVRVGHLVTARSYMMQVSAGGTLRVSCPGTYTGPIEGQNSNTQSVLKLPNILTVTIPPGLHPAQRELPGFNTVPAGTTLTCAYYWNANARESGITLGSPGGGIPIGGETYTAGDTVTFEMRKPGDIGEDNNGCIR
jgi:hypothetical protein